MSLITLRVGFLAGAIAIALPHLAAADELKPSRAVAQPLSEAQKLMQASPPDMKTALDKVKEAQAVPNPTPVDQYLINEFLAEISGALNDMPTATTAFEAVADSPLLAQDAAKVTMLENAVLLSTNAGHYQKAIQYGTALAALGPVPYKMQAALAVDYYKLNDLPHARDMAQKSIDAAKAAGAAPEQNALVILSNAQLKSNDQSGAIASMEQLAATSGAPENWANLITYTINNSRPREIDAIDLMRLAIVTNAPMTAGDFTLMATLALKKGYPGDAVAASRHGGSAPGASAKAAADERELAHQEAVSKGQTGEYNVQLAEDYYGYGRYAEADAAARRAIAKGHLKDPGEGAMVLGMALVGEGKYDDAGPSFQQVSGGAGATRAAHLWSIYAQSKSGAKPH